MPNIDVSSLSIKELNDLIDQAQAQIGKKEKALVAEAKAKMTAIAQEYGYSLETIMSAPSKGRGSRGKAEPKYRNPDNPSQTWAGRGRKPTWLEAALKQGKKLDSFKI